VVSVVPSTEQTISSLKMLSHITNFTTARVAIEKEILFKLCSYGNVCWLLLFINVVLLLAHQLNVITS
jgi:hypothetical protein